MGEVLANLVPLMLAAALVPAPVILVVLFLRGPHGLAAGAAFVAGMTLVRLVQGILFGFVFAEAGGDGRDGPKPAVAALLVVLGVLLWVTAVRTLLKAEDGDAPPPAWQAKVRSAAPLAAFGIGAGLAAVAAKQWAFTLAALGVIGASDLDRPGAAAAYAAFVIAAQSLVLLPVVACAVARQRSAVALDRVAAWLERNTRAVKIAVSVVFGTYFLWKGVSAFLG